MSKFTEFPSLFWKLLMSQLMKRSHFSQSSFTHRLIVKLSCWLKSESLVTKLSCWQNLCWKQQSWIFPSADGQSIVIGFDGNWWRASEGEGNFRQIPICAMKTFSFFRFSIIIPLEPFYRFYILRQLLLMADRPQPIILSTQIITEICTHTQATACYSHAT